MRKKEELLAAFISVSNLKRLFAEYKAAGVPFVTELRKEAWEGSSFTVTDPDGNWICFSE